MKIKQLNEELEKILHEEESSAWDVIKESDCRYISDLLEPFIFYFGDTMFHIPAERISIEELKKPSGQKGCILVLYKWYYGLYENGKYVDGSYDGANENTPLPIDSTLKYIKINAPLKKFTKDEKMALKIGISDVTQPYGSHSEKSCEFMKKYKINPDIKYVVKGDVMAASYPSLQYTQKKGFVVIIGQHGKGFYDIPISQFHAYCKPETEQDANRAAFIAAQD